MTTKKIVTLILVITMFIPSSVFAENSVSEPCDTTVSAESIQDDISTALAYLEELKDELYTYIDSEETKNDIEEVFNFAKGIIEKAQNDSTIQSALEYIKNLIEQKKAEKEKETADQMAADEVTALINALPEQITPENKDAVDATQTAYNELTADQKSLVGQEMVEKLTKAVKTIEDWESYNKAVEAAENATVKISSLKAKKGRKAVVKWSSAESADSYQIRYSTSRMFSSAVKKKTQSGTSVTLKKLKAGKKYYIQVRPVARVTNNATGETSVVYGAWTKAKKVKVKK